MGAHRSAVASLGAGAQEVAWLPLSDGDHTLVDLDVYEALKGFTWYAPKEKGKRYAVAWINGQRTVLHHYVLPVPKGKVRDHINGDSLDNRRANLRACTARENHRNRRRPSNNTSGYKGVIQTGGQFRAVIMVAGRQISLGGFPCAIQAAVAYDRAAAAHFGDYGRLNFDPARDWLLPEPEPSSRSSRAQARVAAQPQRRSFGGDE